MVLVVIDAFREDFFFKSKAMKKVRDIVQRNEAHAFLTKLQSPTVTLPRIKVSF